MTARIAVQYARQQIGLHQVRLFEQGLVGSKFTGQAVKDTKCGEFDAVHVEVAGNAYYTGKCTFTVEKDDPFREGFLLKWNSAKLYIITLNKMESPLSYFWSYQDLGLV